ncbi:hypothetical protein [Streptomyces jeddahensis]|uniref:hypothetical protein n=1 Tax=Streptomyces jeddahensis TaxID=1716141 RepID=UPI0012FF6AAE|nr:hypothetical protein [Streptomyces jeddahensis]
MTRLPPLDSDRHAVVTQDGRIALTAHEFDGRLGWRVPAGRARVQQDVARLDDPPPVQATSREWTIRT